MCWIPLWVLCLNYSIYINVHYYLPGNSVWASVVDFSSVAFIPVLVEKQQVQHSVGLIKMWLGGKQTQGRQST